MTALKLLKSKMFRLLLIFATLFAGAAILVVAYVSWNSNHFLERRLKQTILAETLGLAEQYRSGGISKLVKVINRRIVGPSNSIYLVTDRQGGWIAGNVKNLTRELWSREGRVAFVYQRETSKGRETRHAVAHIFRLARGYRLMVGKDVEEERRFARIVKNALLSGLAFMVFVGVAGGWLVTQNILGRINAVTTTSRTIMAGNMSGRIPIDGSGDELDRLAVNLNAMLERMEQLMMGLKDVSSNIAHDLKTPLNRIRTRIETVLREEEQEQYGAVLGKTIDECDELIRTFDALLSIAKLEAGNGTENFALIDVRTIVEDVAELYEPLAEENNMDLSVVKGEAVLSFVDRHLLGQALANLIENAIKYGGLGSKPSEKPECRGNIILQVATSEKSVEPKNIEMISIGVSDQGQGIVCADRKEALKRFGRLEKSRSKPGTGLGLSLVAAVAKLHDGELQLANNNPGLVARIIFPRKTSRL